MTAEIYYLRQGSSRKSIFAKIEKTIENFCGKINPFKVYWLHNSNCVLKFRSGYLSLRLDIRSHVLFLKSRFFFKRFWCLMCCTISSSSLFSCSSSSLPSYSCSTFDSRADSNVSSLLLLSFSGHL